MAHTIEDSIRVVSIKEAVLADNRAEACGVRDGLIVRFACLTLRALSGMIGSERVS